MFDNFISLGFSCPTASSMSKFGLRGWSGPFDWLVTRSLKWVLYFMENDFNGFLEKDSLDYLSYTTKGFMDKRSGFEFPHEQEFPFEEKYDVLKQKYQKKINRYLIEVTKKTCFLRSVSALDELEYITQNSEYINRVIKTKNAHNEIIFLIRNDIAIPNAFPFRHYIMPGEYSGVSRQALRGWFDNADEFLLFCTDNYNRLSMIHNIMFDSAHEESIYTILQTRYELLLNLINFDFSNTIIPEKIIIYGAGNIGKTFYNLVKQKCKIECFIDKKSFGAQIDNIPVKKINDINYTEQTTFIVTATYDFENISKEIKKYYNTAKIIPLDKLLNS